MIGADGMIRTKIVATVGPASESAETIGELIEAGVDVLRLNFSHGTLDQHGRVLERIQSVRRSAGESVAVMGDLCGPRIRLDRIEGDAVEIRRGDRIDLVREHIVGSVSRLSTNQPEMIDRVAVGHRVLIDDGQVCLRVASSSSDCLSCTCEAGGTLGTRKGVNLPDSDMAFPPLTDKDKLDLTWALEAGIDYIALSFVRSGADVTALRDCMRESGPVCPIIAKIETPQAIDHLDEIIASADAVLVARGDLGVEMDATRVPLLQKEITRRCQRAGKPVIVATQMLQSMVHSATPTRAEVSDVANAILDSADGVMLSAETSVGAHPVASVRMMNRIAAQTEAYLADSGAFSRMDAEATAKPVTTAVAHGANLLARELAAKVIAVWTEQGETVRLLGKCRPNRPVVGLSPEASICRRMSLYYGVVPVCAARPKQSAAMLRAVDEILLSRKLAAVGDLIVVVDGTRLEGAGATNALLIHLVGQEGAHG